MSKETTYTGQAGEWERLLGPFEVNGGDLAHLEVLKTRLRTLLGQAKDIFTVQAGLVASKQESSQRLRIVMGEGQRIANLLRQALKQQYGIRSEKLAEFGVQPFRGKARKVKKPAEEVEAKPVARSTEPAT
jgi:hypothetical protein